MRTTVAENKQQQFSKFMSHCVGENRPLAVAKVGNSFHLITLLSDHANVFDMVDMGKKFKCLAPYAVVDSVFLNQGKNLSPVSGSQSGFLYHFFANMLSATPPIGGFEGNVSCKVGREVLEIKVPEKFLRSDVDMALVYPLLPDASNVNVTYSRDIAYSPTSEPLIYEIPYRHWHDDKPRLWYKTKSEVFVPEGGVVRDVHVADRDTAGAVLRGPDNYGLYVYVGCTPIYKAHVLGSVELPVEFAQIKLAAAADALKAVRQIFKDKVEKNAIYLIDNSGFPKEVKDAMFALFR